MRRSIATVGVFVFMIGVAGSIPASAEHCSPDTNIASCPNPLNIAFIEGVGNVCTRSAGQIRGDDPRYGKTLALLATYPGGRCKFNLSDPSWATRAVSPWYPSPKQGLYWPGVGPGGFGPAAIDISKGASAPPSNTCVSNVGGPGCGLHAETKLWSGDTAEAAAPGTGAHCGSSHGLVVSKFTAADNSVTSYQWVEWNQSAATILPQFGEVNKSYDKAGNEIPSPSGSKPKIIAFVSARGIGGAGNCGITEPTTGFQVEGVSINY